MLINCRPARAEDQTIFDVGALTSLGVDAALADQFKHLDAFPPGFNTVTLKVNGEPRGRQQAYFSHSGQLCVTASLLKEAGLRIPDGLFDKRQPEKPSCPDMTAIWPQFTVKTEPQNGALELLVPPQALAPDRDDRQWKQEGFAALLNYNTQYMGSRARNNRINYWQAQTEAGFNAGGWVFRSNQSLYRFDDATDADYQNAYVQRTFTGMKSTLQAGQVPLSGALFGVGQVVGFRMTPEQALYAASGQAVVSGFADTPSVVEIRQLGVAVFHTSVPAGPFNLSGFSLLNTRTDLTVSVKGSGGTVRTFVVPAAAYAREGATVSPGLSWGVGRYDQKGTSKHPMTAMLSKGFQLSTRSALQTGGLWAENYRALGGEFNTVFLWRTQMSLQSIAASTSTGHHGMLGSWTLSQPAGEEITISFNGSHQSAGYREFSEVQVREENFITRNKDQYGASVAWSNAMLGSFSLSAGRSTRTQGDRTTWGQVSWGRQIGSATLNVSASRNNSGGEYGREDRVYLSLQFPFGANMSANSTASHSRNGNRYGMRVDQRASRERYWSLSADRDQGRRQNSVTGTLSQLTRLSDLAGSLSADSDHSRSVSLQATGSVVGHRHGVTLSPYQVGDTLGIVQTGQKGGVRVETPSGPVWTDGNGYAVLASLNGWSRSQIEVDTRSLGNRMDVVNGTQDVMPARGSVSDIRFDMVSSRRVLINVRDNSGRSLPAGSAVYGDDGAFITVVDEEGNVFLPDASAGMTVRVETQPHPCRLKLDGLPEAVPEDASLYETINGVCQSGSEP